MTPSKFWQGLAMVVVLGALVVGCSNTGNPNPPPPPAPPPPPSEFLPATYPQGKMFIKSWPPVGWKLENPEVHLSPFENGLVGVPALAKFPIGSDGAVNYDLVVPAPALLSSTLPSNAFLWFTFIGCPQPTKPKPQVSDPLAQFFEGELTVINGGKPQADLLWRSPIETRPPNGNTALIYVDRPVNITQEGECQGIGMNQFRLNLSFPNSGWYLLTLSIESLGPNLSRYSLKISNGESFRLVSQGF